MINQEVIITSFENKKVNDIEYEMYEKSHI